MLVALVVGLLSDPDTTVRMARRGAIEIDLRQRDVTIHASSGDQVTIRGAHVEVGGGTVQVSESRNDRTRGPIEITAPQWARLEISTMGGNVTVSGDFNRIEASTIHGFVHLNGVRGNADITSMVGPIVVSDFRGDLTVDATGGPVSVTDASGEVSIDVVNGAVSLREMHASRISATTASAAIDFAGELLADGRYSFESQNGDVTFHLPGSVSATLRVSTMSGGLTSDIPASIGGRQPTTGPISGKGSRHADDDEHTLVATYGSGRARVDVDVFSGNVIVKRLESAQRP